MSDDDRGLYGKYEVRKLGTLPISPPLTDVFVLCPEKDPTALAALIHYAELTPNVRLAESLREWIQRIQEER